MKKLICLAAVLSLVFSLCSCNGKTDPGTTVPAEQATEETPAAVSAGDAAEIKLETESFPDEAKECAHITAYDADKKEIWKFDTEKSNIGQLDGIQEIGMTSYGYLFNADGVIYCLGTKGEESGKVLWTNKEFMGAGISFAFDGYENLFIAGYFGPDLMVISKEGKTMGRFKSFSENLYWPCDMKIEDGYAVIMYENVNAGLVVNPDSGEIAGVKLTDETVYESLLCGEWNGGVGEYGLCLNLAGDGTYDAMLMNRTDTLTYDGTWTVEDFTLYDFDENENATPRETIKGIFTKTYKTDDPDLQDMGGIGDFGLFDICVKDGKLQAEFSQLNNGDSILSWHSDQFCEEGYSIVMSKEF